MMATRNIAGVLMLAATLSSMSVPAGADCPLIPIPNAWWSPPHEGNAPKAPTQIKDMTREHFENSQNEGASYCLYSPPPSEPAHGLIMFLHGGQPSEVGANDPMLQFLAKAGFYIVYPYIPRAREDGPYAPSRARAALSDALSKLKVERNVDIQRVAVVGQSYGGAVAVRVAATWTQSPAIRAIVLHDPWWDPVPICSWLATDRDRCAQEWDYITQPYTNIACSTRLLMMQAERGTGEHVNRFWKNLQHIARYVGAPGSTTPQRNFLQVPHDVSQRLALGIVLESTLLTPTVLAPDTCRSWNFWMGNWVDDDYGCHLTSMDEYGYWRPTRAAVYEAFYGQPISPDYSPYCNSASKAGSCATTRDMGRWLMDNKEATPMKNAADLNLLQDIQVDHCTP